jgi:hypothetical protein
LSQKNQTAPIPPRIVAAANIVSMSARNLSNYLTGAAPFAASELNALLGTTKVLSTMRLQLEHVLCQGLSKPTSGLPHDLQPGTTRINFQRLLSQGSGQGQVPVASRGGPANLHIEGLKKHS